MGWYSYKTEREHILSCKSTSPSSERKLKPVKCQQSHPFLFQPHPFLVLNYTIVYQVCWQVEIPVMPYLLQTTKYLGKWCWPRSCCFWGAVWSEPTLFVNSFINIPVGLLYLYKILSRQFLHAKVIVTSHFQINMETLWVCHIGWLTDEKGPTSLENLEGKGDKLWAAYTLNKLKMWETEKEMCRILDQVFKLFCTGFMFVYLCIVIYISLKMCNGLEWEALSLQCFLKCIYSVHKWYNEKNSLMECAFGEDLG